MNKTEQALKAAQELMEVVDEYPWQLVPINRHSVTVRALRDALAAISQSEAPAEQPEDERERFEALAKIFGFDNLTREGDEYSWPPAQYAWIGYKAAKRDALTQAPQERAAVTDEQIEELADQYLSYHFIPELLEFSRALLSLSASSEGKKP